MTWLVPRIVAAFGLLVIVALTTTPAGGDRVEAPLWCLSCASFGNRAGVDLLLNVVLYVPLGLGLRLMGVSWRRTLTIAFAITLAIETLQMRIIAGRLASVGDVFANTLGAAAGIVLARRWQALLFPGPRLARRQVALGALAWLGLLVATAGGLRPSLPREEYRTRFGRDQHHVHSFAGRVVAASLDGRRLRAGPVRDSGVLRERLRNGGTLVDVLVVATGEPRDRAPILSLHGRGSRRVLVLAQDGNDLVFERRTRAADVRLRAPALRLPNVFAARFNGVARAAAPVGDTVRIIATVLHAGLRVSAERQGQSVSRALQYSPHLGWSFLLRYDSLDRWNGVITGLWIMCPLLLLGYWAARTGARPHRVPLLGLWCLLAGTLVAIPLVSHFPLPHWWEWLVAAAAVACGWWFGCSTPAPNLPRHHRNRLEVSGPRAT